MIWLSWRQVRSSVLIAMAALLAAAAVLIATGPNLDHIWRSVVLPCAANNDCQSVFDTFRSKYQSLQLVGTLLVALPAVVGIFWGAPLVARELEGGTHKLAWTQGVTRTRWLAVKVAVVGLASMATAGLLSWAVTWWFRPLDTFNMNRFSPGMFGERGVVPIAYAAFAFALGLAAGVLIRRTLPAMAATLVGYTGARLAVAYGLRPHYLAVKHLTTAFQAQGPIPLGDGGGAGRVVAAAGAAGPPPPSPPNGAWVLSDKVLNAAGHVIGVNGGIGANGAFGGGISANGTVTIRGLGSCPGGDPGSPARSFQQCLATFHLKEVFAYQPGSRFWAFQWIEVGVFLVAALVLLGLAAWWVRKRLA